MPRRFRVRHDHGERVTCIHTQTNLDQNACDRYGIVERRVCFHCSENTAAGQWPTVESLPVVPVVTVEGVPAPAVPRSPCTGCGKPDPTRPYGSPAMIQQELGLE